MIFPIRNTFPTSRPPLREKEVRNPHPQRLLPNGTTGFIESECTGSWVPQFNVEANKENIRGLGDIVAKFAEPVKNAIIEHGPEWAKEKLKNCGCDKRRTWLNEHFPATNTKP